MSQKSHQHLKIHHYFTSD